jgi:hypothetical protein
VNDIESKVPARSGMVIDLHGVLGRASEVCKKSRDNKHLSWSLDKLAEHICELHKEPTLETLNEFLSLWRP